MKLYNTLSRTVEDISPLNPPAVGLYTCGPTVYDYQHIGNYAAYVRWDILARTLRANNYEADWYMNITDVGHLVSDGDEGEDKLEKGAKREGKTAWQIADFYLHDFLKNVQALAISIPTNHFIRATDHIPDQIALIQKLEAKGHTYVIKDGVYFDSTTFPSYGQMAQLDIKGLMSGARIQAGEKKHPTDFALWKFSPKDVKRDMEWESPWGKGFPGWHIECSALAMKFLGETLDIHAGGIDHIPLHHTNEIAQSEAATGKPFVITWLHSNFLQVNGQKISKSLGNGYTLQDLAVKGFSPMDFRMFVLQSHYRTEAHFTWDTIAAAKKRLLSLQAVADLRFQLIEDGEGYDFTSIYNSVKESLSDDLNTPLALAALSKLDDVVCVASKNAASFEEMLKKLDSLLGLGLSKSLDIDTMQKELLRLRKKARDDNDWSKSDELRGTLLAQGITVKDTEYGQIWSRAAISSKLL